MPIKNVRENFKGFNGKGGIAMKKALIITATVAITAASIGAIIWHFRNAKEVEE